MVYKIGMKVVYNNRICIIEDVEYGSDYTKLLLFQTSPMFDAKGNDKPSAESTYVNILLTEENQDVVKILEPET